MNPRVNEVLLSPISSKEASNRKNENFPVSLQKIERRGPVTVPIVPLVAPLTYL